MTDMYDVARLQRNVRPSARFLRMKAQHMHIVIDADIELEPAVALRRRIGGGEFVHAEFKFLAAAASRVRIER